MVNGPNQRVVPYQGKWAIKAHGSDKPSEVHDTKVSALKRAKEIAVNYNSKVIIHRQDGTVHKSVTPIGSSAGNKKKSSSKVSSKSKKSSSVKKTSSVKKKAVSKSKTGGNSNSKSKKSAKSSVNKGSKSSLSSSKKKVGVKSKVPVKRKPWWKFW